MRRPTLPELAAGTYDLLVIGGGIIGCGVARDAALRGLRVALVERADFGSGTTSRSTRLIHGGLRYLELYDFGLVREDMRERETLLRIAPHLVRPLPFLVPMYRPGPYQRLRLRAGMVLYDALSFDKSLPGHRFLSRAQTLRTEPNLDPDGLEGAARYFDAQVEFPERLCLENALDAAEHGAAPRTYTEAQRFLVRDGRVVGAAVRDVRTGQQADLRADLTLNVSGAWLDRTLTQIRPNARPLLRTTKGVHLVTPRLGPNAVVLFAHSDRRLFFVVPWLGMSLIGTTDTDEPGPPEASHAGEDDLRYLLEATRQAFPSMRQIEPYYTMAGVRALVRKEGVRESQVSRKHALRDHAAEGGPAGLLSVVGGKLTAYRAIAEDAVDLACRTLGRGARCSTAVRPLPGAVGRAGQPDVRLRELAERLGLDAHQQGYLARQYGRRAGQMLALAETEPRLCERLAPDRPTLLAELVFAAREEAAVELTDVFLRRTPLGFAPHHSLPAAARAAGVLGEELGWDVAEREGQVRRYREHVERQYRVPCPAAAVRSA